ncbi:unnamed protein product [Symbiodinium sp. CCMP2456]|nr:unnamed protein product [Symbiodinium sp. CCMP2456]
MCSRSKLRVSHLLQSGVMDLSSLGGDSDYGGHSSAVQDQLTNVQQIQAFDGAFAAILDNGSVVTWGYSDYGGDSSVVQDQLRDVQQIQASWGAFAAILGDGSVVGWGRANCGGDSSVVEHQLRGVCSRSQ